MAEHNTEYVVATGNDYDEHERTYATFMKLSTVATAAVVLIVISLAIGGVSGAWKICVLGVFLALVSGTIGAMGEKANITPVLIAGAVVVALWAVFG